MTPTGTTMNLFKPKEPEPAPAVTGIDILRQMVKSRNRSPTALAVTADDVPG
jgi:hypothetical protein